MKKILLCLCVSTGSSLFWPVLPSLWLLVFCFAVFLPLFFYKKTREHSACFLVCLIGVAAMRCFFTMQLNWLSLLNTQPQVVLGEVIQQKKTSKNSIQTVLQIHTLDDQNLWPEPRVIIYWKDTHPLNLGDIARFKGNLTPVHGFLNQGGFVSERWFLGQGITATVRNAVLLDYEAQHTRNLRKEWIDAFLQALEPLSQKGIFAALVFGTRGQIDFPTRQVFQQAGIAHLLVISGLHIGLLAAWVFWWVRPWCSYRVTAILVLAVASGYAALAGFSPPTQRALYVVALLLMSQISGTHWPKSILMMVCFIGIVLLDPWAVFSMSFWLSFSAVCVLALCHTLWQTRNVFAFQMQLGLFMVPVQAFFFSGISPLSVAFNLLSVPLFCVLIVPATLILSVLLTMLPDWALLGFSGLNVILEYFTQSLLWSQKHLPLWFDISQNTQFFMAVLVIVACGLYFKMRPVFFYMAIFVIGLAYIQPKPNWKMDVLDVGDFMAVLVRTPSSVILYEDLLSTSQGRVRFHRVVVPTLKKMGVKEISLLIHQSSTWGQQTPDINRLFPVKHLWVNQRSDHRGHLCRRGQHFSADNLHINVLWPYASIPGKSTGYCAVHIRDGVSRVLLSGILSRAQQQLIQNWPEEERSFDLWVTPRVRIEASSIKSLGYVQSAAWQPRQDRFLSTGEQGQIHFLIDEKIKINTRREQGPWYLRLHQLLGVHSNPS